MCSFLIHICPLALIRIDKEKQISNWHFFGPSEKVPNWHLFGGEIVKRRQIGRMAGCCGFVEGRGLLRRVSGGRACRGCTLRASASFKRIPFYQSQFNQK
jgi:hypothetical protein